LPINVGPLRKILELEHQRGYEDSAVIGGLDKFLGNWAIQAAESITSSQLLSRFHQLGLAKPDYASRTRQQRREWVSNVLNWLADAGPETAETGKAKPARVTRRPPATRKAQGIAASQSLDSPITVIKGISSTMESKFNKLGVKTVRDLLYFFPHRHLDYSQRKTISQLVAGEEQTIIANVWQAYETRPGGRRSTEAVVGDETGNIRIVWFNNPYLAKKLLPNTRVVFSGRVSLFSGRLVFESPEWELEDQELTHTGRLVPLYSLTQGLRPRQVRKLMKEMVSQWAWQVEDFLPPELKQRCDLLDLTQAISQAHYPEDGAMKDRARIRLAFDELFLLQLGVLSQKRDWQESQPSTPFRIQAPVLDSFIRSLPFTLTEAQQRVLQEIITDLQKPQPMCRLLQGEVGSGKTVVATVALLLAAANGYQGAFMAPTEILAEQHFTIICQLLSRAGHQEVDETYLRSYSGLLPQPLTVAILIGDITQSKKQELQQLIRDGDVDIVIGTHALIQKGVEFHRLELAVVDEQHRFGVEQRAALRQKASSPHMLVMTATPIPRTLALTFYGDLDLSVIDQLPPGRQAIRTKWLRPEQRETAYGFLRRQVVSGRQTFIICPLIEESEAIQAKAATAEYERLSREVFPELKLGLLHGRLRAEEKDKVMRHFRAG